MRWMGGTVGLASRVVAKARRIAGDGIRKTYLEAHEKPVLEKACLFEAGQGQRFDGDMFALLRELKWNPDFSDFEAYVAVSGELVERTASLLERYGMQAAIVARGSEAYDELLARCEYLFSDDSFPPYLHKRSGQVYVNTGQGTNMRRLNHGGVRRSAASFGNRQKNLLAADYLLFPSDFARAGLFEDYRLSALFSHSMLMADRPRNDALTDAAIREIVREAEGLEGKQAVAYVPEWPDSAGLAEAAKRADRLESLLWALDEMLPDNVRFYVHASFPKPDLLDCSGFARIRPFPERFEPYDFLAGCDVLVTDCSGALFDFAVTGRKIVLFSQDAGKGAEQSELRLNLGELPFPNARTADQLAYEICRDAHDPYGVFQDEHCALHTGHAASDVLRTVCLGQEALIPLENKEAREVALHFMKDFSQPLHTETLLLDMQCCWPENAVLAFCGEPWEAGADFMSKLPASVPFISLTGVSQARPSTQAARVLTSRYAWAAHLFSRFMRKSLASEFDRHFSGVSVGEVVLRHPAGDYFEYVLGAANCEKQVMGDYFEKYRRTRRNRVRGSVISGGFQVVPGYPYKPGAYSDEARLSYLNDSLDARLLFKRAVRKPAAMQLQGLMMLRLAQEVSLDECCIALADDIPAGWLKPLARIGEAHLLAFGLRITKAQAQALPRHNAVSFLCKPHDGYGGRVRIAYRPVNVRRRGAHCRPLVDGDAGSTVVFRADAGGRLVVTVRDENVTDHALASLKLELGYWLSRVRPEPDAIVLFEKNSSRYEESASVVFEALMEAGFDKARFILDDSYPFRDCVPERFEPGIVKRHSLEHYRLFFSANTFIGSEMLSHCMEQNAVSKRIAKRLGDPTVNYVFLQHGVMYMVSLDSAARTFFKPRRTTTGKYRVVTSSELEKAHFVERGGYADDMVYVCGLPKYDRNVWDAGADRIAIMPTWRPWEENQARVDFFKTGYYELLETMVGAVPDALKDRVVVLPHPLFKRYAEKADFPLKEYIDFDSPYDDVLRHTKLLVTDYSSIAYDAFFRGANVVFYWQDLQDCMKAYGESTTLMIDDETAFGDTCRTPGELRASIQCNARSDQDERYLRRYRRIVEFHDGGNTKRLIEMLVADGIIGA